MIVIKKVNISSAFKVGAIVSGLISAVFGLLFIALQGLVFSAFMNLMMLEVGTTSGFDTSGMNMFGTLSLAFLCVFYIINVILSAVFGGIMSAVTALAYNLAANWVGGLELQMERVEKLKNNGIYE